VTQQRKITAASLLLIKLLLRQLLLLLWRCKRGRPRLCLLPPLLACFLLPLEQFSCGGYPHGCCFS
jgi:hypothetical protein